MALVTVHKIMIATAILFCLGFGVRGFVYGQPQLGGVFVGLTAALIVYFRWFLRTKGRRAD